MATRGIKITLRLLTTGEERPLSVGQHMPLGLFKAQLAGITGIPAQYQVLQLLDLRSAEERDWRDPENALLEEEFRTLGGLAVSDGSVLALHSLAPHAPNVMEGAEEQAEGPARLRLSEESAFATVATALPPRDRLRGHHSYAGIIFDVEAVSDKEVFVTSVHVAGMLGRVRVFARDASWKDPPEEPSRRIQNFGWGGSYELDRRGWTLVHDERAPPSWNTARELRLAQPVHLLPHQTRALFVHSDLPDDLGVQYMEYRGGDAPEVVGEDACVRLLPGLGFTGQVPFDTRNHAGWYRPNRGPAGALSYAAQPLRWTLARHREFPAALRAAVRAVLLSAGRPESPLFALPQHLVLRILECCHWDWAVAEGAAAPTCSLRLARGAEEMEVEAWTDEAEEWEEEEEEEDEEDEDDEDEWVDHHLPQLLSPALDSGSDDDPGHV